MYIYLETVHTQIDRGLLMQQPVTDRQRSPYDMDHIEPSVHPGRFSKHTVCCIQYAAYLFGS